jgi:hypothetical protein
MAPAPCLAHHPTIMQLLVIDETMAYAVLKLTRESLIQTIAREARRTVWRSILTNLPWRISK